MPVHHLFSRKVLPSGFSAETREMHGSWQHSEQGSHPFRRGGGRYRRAGTTSSDFRTSRAMLILTIPEACSAEPDTRLYMEVVGSRLIRALMFRFTGKFDSAW